MLRTSLLATLMPVLTLLLSGSTAADTVLLKGGKKLSNVTVSRNDSEWVVVNPWNSRIAAMTWEIPDRNRIPADRVEQVILQEDPLIEYRRRLAGPPLTAEDHLELAELSAANKWKDRRQHHLAAALLLQPDNQQALAEFGATDWATFQRKNPSYRPEAVAAARAYVQEKDLDLLGERFAAIGKAGDRRPLAFFERARRSARIQKGRRDKVPLTIRSQDAVGATYAVYVPKSYDPLRPTALLIGLHGGGRGGRDETLVTGSGEAALNWYQQLAEQWGWIVACPTALKAPWRQPANAPVLEGLLDEMKMLFHIDARRIYLAGHSMGGFGTWHWGPKMQEVWAACAPSAGGGGPNGIKIPIYIYHGADDPICRVGPDRSAAKALSAGGKKGVDFVYTELDGVGHGFPESVRQDIFRWFAGRWKEKLKGKHSSFEAKVSRQESKAFGDPQKLPEPGEQDDASLRELLSDLRKGGGIGQEAAAKLGDLKSKAAVRALAGVLRSNKSSVDTRVLAAEALGRSGLREAIDPLAGALKADDFRIVDAATISLGSLGGEESIDPLLRAGRRMGELFEGSFFGDAITFTEYEVRLNSFGSLVDALLNNCPADRALPLIEREIVDRVYDPRKMYRVHGDDDSRFRDSSRKSRLALARKLIEACLTWKDPAAVPLLNRIRSRWSDAPTLPALLDQAIRDLGGAESSG